MIFGTGVFLFMSIGTFNLSGSFYPETFPFLFSNQTTQTKGFASQP